MDERVLRQRVGVVVLAAALISAFLVARFGDLPVWGPGTYTVFIRFPRAPGVEAGTPVRISGVQIGRVTAIKLDPPNGVLITTQIDKTHKVMDCDTSWVTTASVLGDSIVEFIPPKAILPSAKPIEDGTEIVNGQVATNPFELLQTLEPSLKAAMGSITGAGTEVQVTARNLNTVLANNEDQFPRLAQKAERALDQFSQAMTGLNQAIGDPQTQEGLKRSLQDLPQMMDEARGTLRKANEAFDGFKSVSDRATRNLENLENFTKPLGERGPTLVQNLDGSLANINELLEQLVRLTDGLNSQDGTIGRLLHDDQLYRRLDHSLANVEDITTRIKPIVGDFRILSDKLARDPSIIFKLSSILDRRPPGMGTKATPYAQTDAIYLDENGDWDPVVLPHR